MKIVKDYQPDQRILDLIAKTPTVKLGDKEFPIRNLNELPYDEVVDTVGDFFVTAATVEIQLADGWQTFEDLIAIAARQADIQDIVASVQVFSQQLLTLNPAKSIRVLEQVEIRLLNQFRKDSLKEVGKLINAAMNYIATAIRTWARLEAVVDYAIEGYNEILDVFAGKQVPIALPTFTFQESLGTA